MQSFGYFIVFCRKRWLSFVLCSWAVFLEKILSSDCQYLLGVSTPRKWIPTIIPPKAPRKWPSILLQYLTNHVGYTQRSQGPKHIINYMCSITMFTCAFIILNCKFLTTLLLSSLVSLVCTEYGIDLNMVVVQKQERGK